MPQLANNESRGFTHYFRIPAAELVSGGTAARTVARIPRGGIVTNAAVTVITPIVGASDITFTLGLPLGAGTFIASTDLDALTATAYNTGTLIDTEPGYVNNDIVSVPILATLGGTVASITAGEIVIALTILDPFDLAANA
jgi:hypothetical protein